MTKSVSQKHITVIQVNEAEHDGSGVSCKFYRENEKGYKIYECKYRADFAFRNQRLAAKNKLGPQVGSRIIALNKNQKFIGYGFETQVAQKFDGSEDAEEVSKSLRKKLKKIGIDFCDCHHGNIGKIQNKIVCIDFDPRSITEIRKAKRK